MEVGGTSWVDSGLTGGLGSLEELRVEAGVLLGLLRLGRTLKRFLLVDKELVDALRPATTLLKIRNKNNTHIVMKRFNVNL